MEKSPASVFSPNYQPGTRTQEPKDNRAEKTVAVKRKIEAENDTLKTGKKEFFSLQSASSILWEENKEEGSGKEADAVRKGLKVKGSKVVKLEPQVAKEIEPTSKKVYILPDFAQKKGYWAPICTANSVFTSTYSMSQKNVNNFVVLPQYST